MVPDGRGERGGGGVLEIGERVEGWGALCGTEER